jgi:hypothetical protein
MEFWVCNDTAEAPKRAELRWQMEVAGKEVHAQRAAAQVKPSSAEFQGFAEIPIPNVERRTLAKLRLALFDGEKLLHDTEIDLEFFPKPKANQTGVVIVGKRLGAATRLAKELNLKIAADAQVYLIDDFGAYEKRSSQIDAALASGATAVFLNLSKGEYVLPGSIAPVKIESANPHFMSRKTGHPLVAGFQPNDFEFWFDKKAGMLTPLGNGKFKGSNWKPILLAQGVNGVAERSVGRGKVILCELFLADRVGVNPTARLFAERLLAGH